ncbi:metallophosphoesterase [uncultured Modestobacter sp.]|uniref:metallophosphoesterase n=1 Tax=uncultured Modestobacter sp. TaxID=380048 RepID=UPI002601FC24|nr:metallophosphoesterase [uncultured Modestobacter sp.]
MLLLHGYVWWRLVRGTTRPGRVRRRLTVLTVVLALLPTAAVVLSDQLPPAVATPLDWAGYTWLGVVFYLFLAVLATEPIRLVAALVRRRRRPAAVTTGAGPAAPEGRDDRPHAETGHETGQDETGRDEAEREDAEREDAEREDAVSRRLFLARTLAVGAGAVAVGTAGTGVVLANSAPVVRRVPIRLPGLDPALAGLRIVTFADGHLSSTYGGRRFERVVELVNAQRPDVVAIVGDLVDGDVAQLREDVAPLADLVSEQGVFFVTGNHEYFVDTQEWMRHLPTLGVDVLRNERVSIGRGGATFDLAGIDDRVAADSGVPGHGADLDAALDGRDDATPLVLMAHQPVMVEQARAAGVGLQLSGHTHGGQLWPFDYAVLLDQPAVEGWSMQGDTQLYVTSGAGYWGPPMRVGARPEVTVIELQPGDPAPPPS